MRTIKTTCAVCGPIEIGKRGEMRSWTSYDECAFIVPVEWAKTIPALGRAYKAFSGLPYHEESPDRTTLTQDFVQKELELIHGCADEWDYEKWPDFNAHKLAPMLCWTNEEAV